MDFGGGPLWDGTALADILSFERVVRKRQKKVFFCSCITIYLLYFTRTSTLAG